VTSTAALAAAGPRRGDLSHLAPNTVGAVARSALACEVRPSGKRHGGKSAGPVEVCSRETWVQPGRPQQRLLLGVSALRVGQVVPTGQLIGAAWDEEPPRSARNSIQVLITRPRPVRAGTPGVTITRCGDGYQLDADPGQVDVYRFRRLSRQARGAADSQLAVALFEEALALWRGPALADAAETARTGQIRSALADVVGYALQEPGVRVGLAVVICSSVGLTTLMLLTNEPGNRCRRPSRWPRRP
jgi:Bacterial transcriptional activator domain